MNLFQSLCFKLDQRSNIKGFNTSGEKDLSWVKNVVSCDWSQNEIFFCEKCEVAVWQCLRLTWLLCLRSRPQPGNLHTFVVPATSPQKGKEFAAEMIEI